MKLKRSGERGSPCRTPLLFRKNGPTSPLIEMAVCPQRQVARSCGCNPHQNPCSKGLPQEIPVNTVISLLEVEFEEHSTVLSLPDVVYDFHESQQTVQDVSALDKHCLIQGYDHVCYRIQFGGVSFGDDFENYERIGMIIQ
jgi:hypothetical protein